MDVEQHLRKFRIADPDLGLKTRLLDRAFAAPVVRASVWRVWWPAAAAAAAAAVIAVGVMQSPPAPRQAARATAEIPAPGPAPVAKPAVELVADLIDGRGQVRAVTADTRFTVLDAARGRVRLDRGELFVQVSSNSGLRAEIETPEGISARGTSFYARYEPGQSDNILTVAVMNETAEISNVHGTAVGEADELLVGGTVSIPTRQTSGETQPGRSWGRRSGGWSLLMRPEVQADLKLTDEQKTAVLAAMKDGWRDFAGLSRGMRGQSREEMARRSAEYHRAREKRAAELLTAEQSGRLRQIGLQQEGFAAMGRPEIADALGLTEIQRKQIEDAVRDAGEQFRGLFASRERNWEELARRKAAIQQQSSERIGAVLSAEQAGRWKEMLGDPLPLERRKPPTHRWDGRGRPDGERGERERNGL